MDRNYALEFVRVTESAALSSAKWMGRGDEKAADQAAVESMRAMLNSIHFDGRVVIGEGERDEAPMLYIGEKVGAGNGAKLDLALDPLEGTSICARGNANSLSVIAIAEEGNFLHAPDVYMDKIAVGPELVGITSLELSPLKNLKEIARKKKCDLSEITAVVLDRPRHAELIHELRSSKARIWFINDGDVSAAIATALPDSGVDILFGIGGAPEGVIAAAALKCLDGDFQGKLVFRTETEKSRASKMGIDDFNKIYSLNDLARGHVMFCATGVTDGSMLKGVRFTNFGATTNSVVMRSETGTIRKIESEHRFHIKSSRGENAKS